MLCVWGPRSNLCFQAIQPHGLPVHLHTYLPDNNKEREREKNMQM